MEYQQRKQHISSPSNLRKTNLFYPTPPTPWETFRHNPSLCLTQWLYKHQSPISARPTGTLEPIRVVCISDTHNSQPKIPDGDILLHAGDLTDLGTFPEIQAQLDWLETLPYTHKIIIAGNHDRLLDDSYGTHLPNLKWRNEHVKPGCTKQNLNWGASLTYLENTSASLHIRGRTINVYGSPLTPEYGNWGFQYARNHDIWKHRIPESTDIVLTHGPAKGHLDLQGKGCTSLNRELWRVRPRLHVCGHIHFGRGVERVDWGWLQWCCDKIWRGEKGLGNVFVIVGVWVGMWVLWMLGRKRRALSVLANVAVVSEEGLKGVTVVEI